MPDRRRHARADRRAASPLLAISFGLAIALAGCGSASLTSPTPVPLPSPICGGLKIAIPDALPCDRIVTIALQALAERAPDQLRRGIAGTTVVLSDCPRSVMPPQVDCGTEQFAQLVTVTFGPARPGGPMEPSLTVAVGPVSGRVLGISNPFVR